MKNLLCNFIFCLIFFFFCANINAQNFSINAIITDNNDEKIPFATTSLWRVADSTLIKYNISKEDGSIFFDNVPANTYQIRIQMQGFDGFKTENILVDKDIDLGKITLKSVETNLETVEIKAKKELIEVYPDKIVFNTESSIAATGTNAFELLRKAPSVVIDNNDNIILQGKPTNRIYIDGRPSPLTGKDLADYLKTINSTDIEAIELITQPSSKYDASGNAGIINIRFKKNKNLGTNGSFNIGFNYGKYARYNGGLTLNHRTKKVSYFANYSPRIAQDYGFLNLDRFQQKYQFDQTSQSVFNNNSHNLRAGADFFLHKKHTLGIGITANINTSKGITNSNTNINPLFPTTTMSSEVLKAKNENSSQRFNGNFNVNYRFADTLGRSLEADINIGKYQNDRNIYQPNTYISTFPPSSSEQNYRMITPTNISLWNAKIDYAQKLGKGKMEAGIKFAIVTTDNNFRFFDVNNGIDVLNLGKTNFFSYTENVNAGYFNYQIKIKKWEMQAGLRVEQTHSKGTLVAEQTIDNKIVKREYIDFFPSFGVSYNLNQNNSFGLRYSKRIERPNYQDLNPFENRLDELNYQKGNPFLNPQYTQSMEVSHNYKYTLNTSLSYGITNGFFAQVTDTTQTTKSVMTTQNFGSQSVWNLSIGAPLEIKKWWNMYMNVNFSHSNYFANFGQNRVIDRQIQSFNFYAQHTFSLPKKFTFEVSGFYTSPSIWAGVYRTKSLGNVDIALQKKFWNDNANIKITFADVFFTMPWRAVNEFSGLYINGTGGSDTRQIRLNFSYSFGNKQVKSIKQRKTGSEEERQRIGN